MVIIAFDGKKHSLVPAAVRVISRKSAGRRRACGGKILWVGETSSEISRNKEHCIGNYWKQKEAAPETKDTLAIGGSALRRRRFLKGGKAGKLFGTIFVPDDYEQGIRHHR